MLDTLSNVKSRLGITDSDSDVFLTQQIELISDVIEAYCRRKFLRAKYRQTFYDYVGYKTELFHFPTISVESIVSDGRIVVSNEYIVHKPTSTITMKHSHLCKDTEVVFEAGYDTCPLPILSVLDSIVGERYNKKKSGVDLNFGSDVQRISIPGAISIDFDYSLSNNDRQTAYGVILGNNANILDDWRSERAVIGSGKLEYIEEEP